MEEKTPLRVQNEHEYFVDTVHDLKAPLAVIAGYADALLSGVVPKEKEEQYLKTISSESKRLSRMITDLLTVERIRLGEGLDLTSVDLAEIARQVLLSFEKLIEEKRLSVSFSDVPDRVKVLIAPDALYRVIYNLLDNAVKFSREGGSLSVSLTSEKEFGVFSVRNEGEGISEEALTRVFDRFYSTKEGNPMGSGIGLFASKAIVEKYSGRIEIASEYGRSCTVIVALPRDPLSIQ